MEHKLITCLCCTGCGDACTDDGIHYLNATYDAALQIWSCSFRAASKNNKVTK